MRNLRLLDSAFVSQATPVAGFATDDFESYSAGAFTSGNGGAGWATAYALPVGAQAIVSRDDFEAYAVGSFATGSLGEGWSNGYSIQ